MRALWGLSVWLFIAAFCSLSQADVDTALVYYGDSEQDFYAPGEINCAEVFVQIPEYQKILQENLDTKSGKYWTLLRKANDKFQTAVRKTAKRHGLDLVCEKGLLSGDEREKIRQNHEDAEYKFDYTEEVKALVSEKKST